MLIHHSFDQRFVTYMEKMRKQYGDEIFELTGIGDKSLDINRYSADFFGSTATTADKTIDGNANVSDTSVNAWESELKKPIMKLNALYQLWKSAERKHGIKRANKLIEHEIRGAIRIHDCHLWNKAYCYAYSLNHLVNEGMPFYNKIKIGPVKHFDSFINLSLQFLCYASNQIAGAVAFPDFLVYAEYFIRKDYGELWYEDANTVNKINQLFQNWIYSVNFSWRSNQTAFTNVSVFDKEWLKAVFAEHINPDFSSPDFNNTMRVQKLFVNEMRRNLKDNPFTFPVMTACLLYNKELNDFTDQEFFEWVSDVNAETGLFNIFHDSDINSISSCCRLRNNFEVSKEYTNSFGAGGLSIGSHRVVTINLPQIAYQVEDWDEYMKLLEYRISISHDILDIHRETIQKHINEGRLPLYRYHYMDLSKQFSTLGFIGLHEALEIMGTSISDENGKTRAFEILGMMNKMNEHRTKKDGNIRNVEQIPGESAASNFAKKDKLLFSEVKGYQLYSNQYIPLIENANLIDRINIQGMFDSGDTTGGGAILHINLDSQVTKEQMADIIRYAASQGVIYWAINYGISVCSNCGKTYIGKYDKSPCHGAETEKWIRIVGFMVPVSSFSTDRKIEYEKRQFYNIGSEVVTHIEKS
jgi:ribonucleoside-triphosphate reductase (formate)